MKIAVNTSALSYDDLDFSEFDKLGEITYFGEVTREELVAIAKDCDALVVNKLNVDRELIAACPKLKYVGVFATGYNVIDVPACTERGITVCNSPNYSTYAVSEHVFALLLNYYGKISEYTASVAAGDWVRSKAFCYVPFTTHELHGKKIGIYGYGNIGSRVAKLAEAFGMEVYVAAHKDIKECPYKQLPFEELLKTCDVISLHCPLNEETANLINNDALALMKKDAVLINTARGGLVDENALAEALNEGRIAAALLDTVKEEPMLADNPLLGAKNCYITPHVSWVAHETRTRLVNTAAANLKAFIEGKPVNTVN